VSSAFDFLTFAALVRVFHATPELFRTSWFVESLLTELVVALVIRTRRPFYRSRPGTLLLVSTVVLIPLTLAIPFLPGASMLGFVPLPGLITVTIVALAVSYVAVTELQKAWFYRSR
jgi:Mg2+-importing ATPase